jgi:hypothetical protein
MYMHILLHSAIFMTGGLKMVEISDNSREFSHMSSSNVDMYRHQVEDNIASKYEPIVHISSIFIYVY